MWLFNSILYNFRSSVQTLAGFHAPLVNIYDQMTDEQINEEFEKSLLVKKKFKLEKNFWAL